MNINIHQLEALKRLISIKDRKIIAMRLKLSPRTIDAVLQNDRANDKIERELVRFAKQSISAFSNMIADIEAKNLIRVDVEDYSSFKSSPSFTNHPFYVRYMDVYIQLSQVNFESLDELWERLLRSYKDIIPYGGFCIHLLERLAGVEEKTAVKYYNEKASKY